MAEYCWPAALYILSEPAAGSVQIDEMPVSPDLSASRVQAFTSTAVVDVAKTDVPVPSTAVGNILTE